MGNIFLLQKPPLEKPYLKKSLKPIKMTSPTNTRRRFTLLFLVAISISTDVLSQSRLFVGIHTTPTYFSNFRKYANNTYEFYYGLNRKQFYLTNGLLIEYKFDKKLSILFNPGIFKRRFNSDCVDENINGKFYSIYFISKDNNCLFSAEHSFNFLRMPLMLKIAFNKSHKINTYIAFGNSITYCFRSISSLKRVNSGIEVRHSDQKGSYFESWISPILEAGSDFNFTKRIALNSNINVQTEQPLISNFSLGGSIGLKIGL